VNSIHVRSPRRASLAIAGLAILTLAAAACGDDTKEDASVTTDSAQGAAASSPFDGTTYLSTGTTGFDLVDGSRVRIEFADARLSANAGCNTQNGGYSVEGDVLKVDTLASTQMACDEPLMTQDATIAALLSASPTFTLDGDTLTLTDGTKTLTLQDSKVADPARPLSGTAWTVTSVVTKDAMTSLADATATIMFEVAADGTGTAQVNAGCNTGQASVTVTDTDITWGPLALTKKMCEGNAMELETAVTTTLQGTTTYTIEGGTLSLKNGSNGLELSAGS
jgi:heat shock protein HslJ